VDHIMQSAALLLPPALRHDISRIIRWFDLQNFA
jgi:hypothetical protein